MLKLQATENGRSRTHGVTNPRSTQTRQEERKIALNFGVITENTSQEKQITRKGEIIEYLKQKLVN